MSQNLLALIAFVSPFLFMVTAIASWFQPGLRPRLVKNMAMVSTVVSIVIALVCGYQVAMHSLLETSLIGFNELGMSLRLDAVSILMLTMIALLSFIIIKYSLNYLDGDRRQGTFIGRLSATIASVQLLVLSGNLGLLFVAWVLTSMSLHRLLVFYRERPVALIAARKKFIVARLGDICLLIAVGALYLQFGTGNLEAIFQGIKNASASGLPLNGIETAAIFLAAAAILKSAQFPTHGWLIEVMETPTPVSALLHAGLLNAGPFLIVRMAFVIDASSYAPQLLLIIGGLTALFASVVFLTQTSIKTALAYSSVAHMGFSLLVCGLGVYPAAMLHLVAHSFYKAHSFLSSGSVIEVIKSSKITAAKRTGKPLKIVLGVVLALSLYTLFAIIWGVDPHEQFSLMAIGAVIVMGLSRIFTSAIDSERSLKLFSWACLIAFTVTISFFTLETGMHHLLDGKVPELAYPGITTTLITEALLVLFALVTAIQIIAPSIKASPAYLALAIHLRNGLYINTLFDRTVRALYAHGELQKPEIAESIEYVRRKEPLLVEDFENQPA